MLQGLSPVAAGVGIGLVSAMAITRVLQSLLFGVTVLDPTAFGGAAMMVVLTSAVACYVPGRRAARLDPMTALRYE
jgi:putative ABC transport system permease protein